jgi:hypothetical protein
LGRPRELFQVEGEEKRKREEGAPGGPGHAWADVASRPCSHTHGTDRHEAVVLLTRRRDASGGWEKKRREAARAHLEATLGNGGAPAGGGEWWRSSSDPGVFSSSCSRPFDAGSGGSSADVPGRR